ncbi:uncharacterized protein BDZ99DRAFT_471918 [Mytilinidion resinicola]|uniref:Uncharacterized protein n=1 Tax=Mytilinidion resinicola TaxID=574789 RepID=A0A6A6Z6I6_9PEZI|nr:uncharacterized protein BDZ99DRAFT_471918 [Mytilinidion resinicola]KAF2816711.1 hypothetical protein BDZ99DRAFT_471918 [Mytilinidion resinicola]
MVDHYRGELILWEDARCDDTKAFPRSGHVASHELLAGSDRLAARRPIGKIDSEASPLLARHLAAALVHHPPASQSALVPCQLRQFDPQACPLLISSMDGRESGPPGKQPSDGTPPRPGMYPQGGIGGLDEFDDSHVPYFTNTLGLDINAAQTPGPPMTPQQHAPHGTLGDRDRTAEGSNMFNDDYIANEQVHNTQDYANPSPPRGGYGYGYTTETLTRTHRSTLMTNSGVFTGRVGSEHGSSQDNRSVLGHRRPPANEPASSTRHQSDVPDQTASHRTPARVLAAIRDHPIKPPTRRKRKVRTDTNPAAPSRAQPRSIAPLPVARLEQAHRPVQARGMPTPMFGLDHTPGYRSAGSAAAFPAMAQDSTAERASSYGQPIDEGNSRQLQDPYSTARPNYHMSFGPTLSPFFPALPSISHGRAPPASRMYNSNTFPTVVNLVEAEDFDHDRETRMEITENRYRLLLGRDNPAPFFRSWSSQDQAVFLEFFPAFMDRHRDAEVLTDVERLALYRDYVQYRTWVESPIDVDQTWANLERYGLIQTQLAVYGHVDPEQTAQRDPTPDLDEERRRMYGAPVRTALVSVEIPATERLHRPVLGSIGPPSASRIVQNERSTETTQKAPRKSKKDRSPFKNDILKGRTLNRDGMYFSSAEEGDALFRERPLWRPKRETLPSERARLPLVRALQDAMVNLDGINDRLTNRLARWRPDSRFYDPVAIELAAHKLLAKIFKLHEDGWTRPVLDPTQESLFDPEPDLSFLERFEAIREVLYHWKATAKMVLQGDDLKIDQFIAGPNERAERSGRYSEANIAKQIIIEEGRLAKKGNKRSAAEAFSSEGREARRSTTTLPRQTLRASTPSASSRRRNATTAANAVESDVSSETSETDDDTSTAQETPRDPKVTRRFLPRESKNKKRKHGQ